MVGLLGLQELGEIIRKSIGERDFLRCERIAAQDSGALLAERQDVEGALR